MIPGIAAGIALKLMETGRVGPLLAKIIGYAVVTAFLIAILYAGYCWSWDRGRDHERSRWEAAAAKIEAADVKADAAGTITAAQTKGKIDATNERAANAAAQSDDPLAAGFGELRKQGSGKGN